MEPAIVVQEQNVYSVSRPRSAVSTPTPADRNVASYKAALVSCFNHQTIATKSIFTFGNFFVIFKLFSATKNPRYNALLNRESQVDIICAT